MRVLVLSTMVPFIRGGAEELFDHLVLNLRKSGATAEGFRIPFSWDPPERLIDEMAIARRIRVCNIDRVIALKFPAYMVPWHNKVLWLLHQFRQAYDLREVGQSHISMDASGDRIASAIRSADNVAFSEARQIHTIAPTVSNRLMRYNGIASSVLRHPLNDPEFFTGGDAGGYLLATGRVGEGKRQHLLIRALKYVPTAKLVIAGPPDTPGESDRLRSLIAREGVEDRVKLDLRFLPRKELANLVNGALAVAYLPYDEDSIGYCTMEAFCANKPVLSVEDAGGVLDIVRNNENGYVVPPEPEELAIAISDIFNNPGRAARLGRAGHAALNSEGLNWPSTIERLLA